VIRVVVDTNVFASGLFWVDPPFKVAYAYRTPLLAPALYPFLMKVRMGHSRHSRSGGSDDSSVDQ